MQAKLESEKSMKRFLWIEKPTMRLERIATFETMGFHARPMPRSAQTDIVFDVFAGGAIHLQRDTIEMTRILRFGSPGPRRRESSHDASLSSRPCSCRLNHQSTSRESGRSFRSGRLHFRFSRRRRSIWSPACGSPRRLRRPVLRWPYLPLL